jgi:hypothetical protein
MRSGLVRRLLASSAAIPLVAAALLTSAAPAAAASQLPWRFINVVDSRQAIVPGGTLDRVLTCPEGYRPIGGGVAPTKDDPSIHHVKRYLEYTDPPTRTYHIGLRNSAAPGGAVASIQVIAYCVWADNLGTINYQFWEFARNTTTGRAGGIVSCPAGYRAITGGADWSGGGATRTIDYSTPYLDFNNNATSWYAAGYSPTSGGTLFVEVYCIEASYLSGFGAQFVQTAQSGAASFAGQDFTLSATCPAGYRTLTAGSRPAGATYPTQDKGWAWASGPVSPRQWTSKATLAYLDSLLVVNVCVRASVPTVSISPAPPLVTNSTDAVVGPSGSDPAGENVTGSCRLDTGGFFECNYNSGYVYSNLTDGTHTFYATITNQSGVSTAANYSWVVDTVKPTLSEVVAAPSASLTSTFTVSFSENVHGVSETSILVHGKTTNVDVAGSVSMTDKHTAVWTPNKALVPGETYRVSLTSAIQDAASNALAATYADVRASTVVENTAVTLERRWDRDPSSKASGGSYIVDRLAGSRADLTFSATAGQTVSLYGIRMPDGGKAAIYLDGVKKATKSFYASSAGRFLAYKSAGLSAGKHTISVRPTGTKQAASSNSWVRVDSTLVGATITQETAFRQAFRTVSSASAFDGSYAQIVGKNGTDTTPAQFRLTGVGTGFKVYATKTTTSGKARIYVDGVLKTTINLRAASTKYKALVYSTTFAAGVHSLRIEAVGTKSGGGSAVNVDRITLN